MSELEDVLKESGDKVVCIDFWASWCGPCKVIGPPFERLAKDSALQSKMVFVKVDVDEASDIAEWVGIECMPTFAFYRNGEKIAEMAGANPDKLREIIYGLAQK